MMDLRREQLQSYLILNVVRFYGNFEMRESLEYY